MADLSKLSTEDLRALKAGDLSKVSTAGLVALRGAPAETVDREAIRRQATEGGGRLQFASPFGTFDTGITTPEWVQNTLAGAGKAFADVVLGAKQLVNKATDEDAAEARRLDEPLMRTGAGIAGNLAGNVAMLAPTAAIPGANTLTGAGAIGAIAGLLQPSASSGEAALNTGLGAAGGMAGRALANRLGTWAGSSSLTQGQVQAAKAGESIGMKLTPGKATGSQMLQKIEAAAESNPMTSPGFDAIRETNQRVLNRAAAKAVGEKADELSAPVIAKAEERIGQVFDSVKDKTPVPIDPITVGARLRQIAQDAQGMLMGNADLADNGLWKRLDSFVNDKGGATREQLRSLSSNLGKAAKANMTSPQGDRELGAALFAAQDVVEDAIEGTLSKAQRVAYQEARGQYRNLMLLTAKTNVTNPSSGNVSGRNLAAALQRGDRGGFTLGRNTSDLYSAARFTQAFPSIVGDSGTATRSLGAADYLTSIPGSLVARAYLSRPVIGAARLGSGAAGLLGQIGEGPANLLGMPLGASLPMTTPYLLQQ